MSRLYDTVEPTVIDDVMLKKTIEEQGPQEEAGNVARKDGIFYEEVQSLRLDFKSNIEKQTKLIYNSNLYALSLLKIYLELKIYGNLIVLLNCNWIIM
jgi:hypothetical protein